MCIGALGLRCTPIFLGKRRSKGGKPLAGLPLRHFACFACGADNDKKSRGGKKSAAKEKNWERGGKEKAAKGRFFQKRKAYPFPQAFLICLWKTLWKLCKTPLPARLWGFLALPFGCVKQGGLSLRQGKSERAFSPPLFQSKKSGYSTRRSSLVASLFRAVFRGNFTCRPLT